MDKSVQTSQKYTSRNSPPYKASSFCGKTKLGNDKTYYISKQYGNQCRWMKKASLNKTSPMKSSSKNVSPVKQTSKTYTSRKSPPHKASAFCGKTKLGNDKSYYISKQYGDQCRWMKKSPT